MKKKTGTLRIIGRIAGFALAAAVFVAGYYLLSERGGAASAPPVAAGASAGFTVDGTIESDEVDVSSKIPGRLSQVSVEEGDEVHAGQVLAVLEAEEIDAKHDQASAGVKASEVLAEQAGLAAGLEARKADDQISQAEAGVSAAKAALGMAQQKYEAMKNGARPQEIEQARQGVAAAKAALDAAQKTWNRISSLAKDEVIAQQKADEVEMMYLSAQAQYNAAKAKYDLVVEGARKEEIEAARQQVEQAKAGVAAAERTLQLAKDAKGLVSIRKLDQQAAEQKIAASQGTLREVTAYQKMTQIIAPIDGVVTQRNSKAGEIVAPGYAIMSISRKDNYWVDVYVDETKFAGHGVGDKVEVSIPALGKAVPGTISRVLPAADFATKRSTNERGVFDSRAVQLRIKLDETPRNMANGLTARVNFPSPGGRK